VRRAWAAHGRDGRPRLLALPYFALGPRAREQAETYLTDHYAIEGPAAASLAATALTDATAPRRHGASALRRYGAITAYEQAGCDELMLFPCSNDPRQVRLLAEAVR